MRRPRPAGSPWAGPGPAPHAFRSRREGGGSAQDAARGGERRERFILPRSQCRGRQPEGCAAGLLGDPHPTPAELWLPP